MEKIYSSKAPAPIGPYSQAICFNNLIFTSGQIPVSVETGDIVGDNIEEQTEQVIKNLKEVLFASGSSIENVIKTTCYLANMQDFDKFNKIYSKHFTNSPARSCFAVNQLPKNSLCEIEVVAYK